ncbi:unnamed protein product [Nippostrongylus brasiliensis]|uniref:Innexin n=1 Tax=Nippostrongylus brasiliensis TaxID=27835 RepID=A0A0N4YFM3_NIPBR|nr:hypothetical protein Q1695_002832 [Nippostrongylus brasiliensis]VDL79159.1 unnamed protein product [Nippostrongylus brasiliensis]
MLSIPFLTKFIEKTIKRQKVADSVDYLNYYVTSMIFAFFALAISAKQYFGSPIQCWVPSEFRGGWEKYAEDYCFIANSYYVPFEEEIPVDIEHRRDHISYYRWVPIMLALQAMMFFIPNWIWNMLHKQTAINPRSFLSEAEKVKYATGEKREQEINTLANYFIESLSVFQTDASGKRYTSPRSGYNATLLYISTKAAYVFNIFLQIIILNHFLGQNYLHWGYEMTSNIIHGNEWKETEVFPRVIMCDFQIRRLANLQRHTVQCVIMMNMINEKLYLFLYFWLFFVGIATVTNFLYFAVTMAFPSLRAKQVLLNIYTDRNRAMGQSELNRFAKECLIPDGVLLLQFVREHVGGRVAYDLINRIYDIFSENDSTHNNSSKKLAPSPIEKYARPPHFLGFPRQSPNQSYFPVLSSAPMLEDYMDHGTMRIGEKDSQIDHSSRRSPTDV